MYRVNLFKTYKHKVACSYDKTTEYFNTKKYALDKLTRPNDKNYNNTRQLWRSIVNCLLL